MSVSHCTDWQQKSPILDGKLCPQPKMRKTTINDKAILSQKTTPFLYEHTSLLIRKMFVQFYRVIALTEKECALIS